MNLDLGFDFWNNKPKEEEKKVSLDKAIDDKKIRECRSCRHIYTRKKKLTATKYDRQRVIRVCDSCGERNYVGMKS